MGEVVAIGSPSDVVSVRHTVRAHAAQVGFSLVDQTKIVTAASELARNTLDYGGGGTMQIDIVTQSAIRGLTLIFEDHGPGIADIDQAMQDGYTTGSGLGLGLSGSRRLVHEFKIESSLGNGTRVAITRWK